MFELVRVLNLYHVMSENESDMKGTEEEARNRCALDFL